MDAAMNHHTAPMAPKIGSGTPLLSTARLPMQACLHGADVWQRSVLFLDVLRERANNMLEHERAGLPPLLHFEYETVMDAREFSPPANYMLLRITKCPH